MKMVSTFTAIACCGIFSAACSNSGQGNVEDAAGHAKQNPPIPATTAKAEQGFESLPGKAGAPFAIDYRIVGTPIVGSPLTVELRIASAFGSRPVQLDYQIHDAASLMLAESQPRNLRIEPAANESLLAQQVSIVPLREGRVYLNIMAAVESENGTSSSVTAIPIHVGKVSTAPVDNGVVEVDDSGENVRVLSNE